MDKNAENPFQAVYLTEALTDPRLYWALFSPALLSGEAGRLYRPGNVVLLGSNGTGKTMLLRLFAAEVQAPHVEGQKKLPAGIEPMFAIGVNLIQDGFNALGNRALRTEPCDAVLWPLMVGDLLNYQLCRNLLKVLRYMSTAPGDSLAKALGASLARPQVDAFAERLAQDECWFDALNGINTLDKLESVVSQRIKTYKAFINWNTRHLPESITETRTEIGSPLSACHAALCDAGILAREQPLMVAIDQYETLLHTDYETTQGGASSTGKALCRVVNTLLARRDPHVSYKIGVRPYAWKREPRALGTDAHLELGRDYQEVNLDEILSRRENPRTAVFPKLAKDVAARRLQYILQKERGSPTDDFPAAFLESITPEKALEHYCRKNPERLLREHPDWPAQWQEGYRQLYGESKLDAQYAEVWISQQLGKREGIEGQFPKKETAPWKKEYWRKERQDVLMMRTASECFQRRLYGGWDDLVTFSAYNILVFLSILREIWDISERSIEGGPLSGERIPVDIQSQAIRLVSEQWFEKQAAYPGGARRQDFVRRLGIGIRKALLDDTAISYPGHNGFSIALDEYEAEENLDVKQFLEDAADYGALIATAHTTKERDKRPRRKFYLFPILCPTFEIPAIRTKEPYYAKLGEVRAWLNDSKIPVTFSRGHKLRNRSIERTNSELGRQMGFFQDTDEAPHK